MPRPGETVRVSLRNGESVEGVVEWVDGNGVMVKGPQKSRWVPLEAFLAPAVAGEPKAKDSGSEE